MKLETKISLLLIAILLILGASFFITGFSILKVLNIPAGRNIWLILLLLVGILILIGRVINRRIRQPLFFFIRWIDQLSRGIFKKPANIKDFSEDKIKFSPFLELSSKLDGLTNQLNVTEKERKELEETRRDWTSGVTHDLKTPLSYIKGYAVMLRSEYNWNEADIRAFAKVIEEKSLYMEQLIDDLSIIYEFDKMQMPLNLHKIDLVAFLENVLEDMRQYPMVNEYSIHLNVNEKNDILLSSDKTLLKRALENIIMNAIQHNPTGTTIAVSVEAKNDSIIIEIHDDGVGMDDKTIQALFNQYYRGTVTDRSHLGSGLGMSIAKQFIEKQGGEIKVKSQINIGTTIKILFPA